MKHYESFVRESATCLSAIVLVGGKSTRFGRDKAEMEFSGTKVLDGLIETLGLFPFQNLAVVGAGGKGGSLPDHVQALEDDRRGLGPLGGILTALKHLPGGVLATACDMPLVSEALIDWLLGHYDARVDAVIPRQGGRVEPLLGIYPVPQKAPCVTQGFTL